MPKFEIFVVFTQKQMMLESGYNDSIFQKQKALNKLKILSCSLFIYLSFFYNCKIFSM